MSCHIDITLLGALWLIYRLKEFQLVSFEGGIGSRLAVKHLKCWFQLLEIV